MSFIITILTNISVGCTVFCDGIKMTDLGNRARVLKHSHGRMSFGPFERSLREYFLWRGHRAVISFVIEKNKNCISFVLGVGLITNI